MSPRRHKKSTRFPEQDYVTVFKKKKIQKPKQPSKKPREDPHSDDDEPEHVGLPPIPNKTQTYPKPSRTPTSSTPRISPNFQQSHNMQKLSDPSPQPLPLTPPLPSPSSNPQSHHSPQSLHSHSPQSPLSQILTQYNLYTSTRTNHQTHLLSLKHYQQKVQAICKNVGKLSKKQRKLEDSLMRICEEYYQEILGKCQGLYLGDVGVDQGVFGEFLGVLGKIVEFQQANIYRNERYSMKFVDVFKYFPKHKRQKLFTPQILNHFQTFPYLTIPQQQIPLIQNLSLNNYTIPSPNPSLNQSQQTLFSTHPYLFIRPSIIVTYTLMQEFLCLLCRLLGGLVGVVMEFLRFRKMGCRFGKSGRVSEGNQFQGKVREAICRAMANVRFISFPETRCQIRGFHFQSKIYINTYYLQKTSSPPKILLPYLILTFLRNLPQSLLQNFHPISKPPQNLPQTIRKILYRKDLGAEFEAFITGRKEGFVGTGVRDYGELGGREGKGQGEIRLRNFGGRGEGEEGEEEFFGFLEERGRIQYSSIDDLREYNRRLRRLYKAEILEEKEEKQSDNSDVRSEEDEIEQISSSEGSRNEEEQEQEQEQAEEQEEQEEDEDAYDEDDNYEPEQIQRNIKKPKTTTKMNKTKQKLLQLAKQKFGNLKLFKNTMQPESQEEQEREREREKSSSKNEESDSDRSVDSGQGKQERKNLGKGRRSWRN